MAAKRMVAGGARAGEIIVVRLAFGELLLESIQEICRQRNIRDGVILTGFGSLTDFAVSGAVGPSFPPRQFYQRTQPRGVEILAMAGVIANYHVHCHLVLSDRNGAFGGHLERGCRVLSLAEIALMRVTGIKLGDELVEVHVVVANGTPIKQTAQQIHTVVAAVVAAPVHVFVEDVDAA